MYKWVNTPAVQFYTTWQAGIDLIQIHYFTKVDYFTVFIIQYKTSSRLAIMHNTSTQKNLCHGEKS